MGKQAKLNAGSGEFEYPVLSGSIGPEVIDIRKLYGNTGMFTYDPGFTSTASCESALTYIDEVYYTKPVTYRRSWALAAPGEELPEFSCEWNTAWVTSQLEPGPGAIGANGNRGFGPGNQILPELPLGAVDSTRGTSYWLYRANKPKPSDPPLPPPARAP